MIDLFDFTNNIRPPQLKLFYIILMYMDNLINSQLKFKKNISYFNI